MPPKSSNNDKNSSSFYAQDSAGTFHFLNEELLQTEEEKIAYYETLVNHYELKEDDLNAFETLEKLFKIKEEAFKREKDEKLEQLKARYESERREQLLEDELKFKKKIERKNAKLQEILANQKRLELHLSSLQLQLSPHFIFNSMQSIQSFILQRDASVASDYLAQFAKLMRSILKSSMSVSIDLKEEIELLENYLFLEAERFSRSFQYKLTNLCFVEAKRLYLPSLLLQPFVENAILHGVAGNSSGKIEIVFRNNYENLFVHVIDNGKGRKHANSISKKTQTGTSTALNILSQRSLLSKDSSYQSYDFRIFDRLKKKKVVGTHVCLRISLNNKSNPK